VSPLVRGRFGNGRSRAFKPFVGVAVAALALALASCGSSSSSTTSATTGSNAAASASSTTASGTTSGKVIHIALIEDLTGSFAPISGPQPSQAYISALNAQGGLDGYQIKTTVYDGQSTPAGTLNAARQAAQASPNAILMGAWNASSANAFLATTGIPVVGFGALGGYEGYNNVFSDIGEAAVHSSDVWIRILTTRGANKIALLDTTIEAKFDALLKKLTPGAGGTVVYDNATLPYPVDSPTALSLAEHVKSSGANGVFAADGGDMVQADLNQLGYKASVLEVSELGPAVIKEWGSKVNGMIFGSAFATAYVKNNPGVTQFVTDMQKYGYSSLIYADPYAIEHFAATKMLLDAMTTAGPPFSPKATVAALNNLHNYTADGLLAFVSFPQWHTIGADCASTATVTNGQWVADKNGTDPFICSKSGSVGF
jgi:branched-chain amino acid transport system substrate-binding protein